LATDWSSEARYAENNDRFYTRLKLVLAMLVGPVHQKEILD
jgi:hypothetical protein